MRSLMITAVTLLVLSTPVWADGTKPIPVDVLTQLKKDLEKFRPEQPPTQTSADLSFQVTKPDALVYAVPDTKSMTLSTLDPGDTYKVLSPGPGDWLSVLYNGKTGWVSGSKGKVIAAAMTDPASSSWDEQIAKLLKQAADLKAQYDKNQYVSVKGFSLDVGIPPSVTIDFEFK